MKKIKYLLSLLESADLLLTCKTAQIEWDIQEQLLIKMNNIHQIVSLAEKHQQVKNACSPKSSEKH